MKIPEYKLKWLEKQLEIYDEHERQFFRNFFLICAIMLDRYLKGNQALAEEPLAMFLMQYASDTMRSYGEDARLMFDTTAHDVNDCMVCAVWCIDLLQAYDKWRKSGEGHE